MILSPGIARAIDAEIASQVSKGISEWRLMNSPSPENKSEIKTNPAAEPSHDISGPVLGGERSDNIEGILALDETRKEMDFSRTLLEPNADLLGNMQSAGGIIIMFGLMLIREPA